VAFTGTRWATVARVDRASDVSVGRVAEINIAANHEELPVAVERVRAVAGRGIEGDRNYLAEGEPQPHRDEDLTLIAQEVLDALADEAGIPLSAAESRRNVVTRDIDLNSLVGRRFAIGGVECEGIELCEPCRHLERLTRPGVLRGLVHRGGLRAAIVRSGEIVVGDRVAPI
jgi:MOSC domain-containing protein YiiM